MKSKKMKNRNGIRKNTLVLTFTGGLVFWLANFAVSRTPIAAEYRTAMSISYYPMLLASLIGGLMISLFVGYILLRYSDKIPIKDPIWKSVMLSMVILAISTALPGNPANFINTSNAVRYFMISTAFNLIRMLALGVAVGFVLKKRSGNPSTIVNVEDEPCVNSNKKK